MSMSTIASTGGGSTGTGASSFAGWGEGWRGHLAAGSTDMEKELKRLERFQGPEDIYKSYRSLEGKVSAGELRSALPKGASPQEVAQWRKDNGVPEKPEDYKITMPAGRQPPKEDDAFLKAFLKSSHDRNYTQTQVDGAIEIFYAEVDRQEKAVTDAEAKAIQTTNEKLRQEWATDYTTNMNMAEALLARAPAGFRDRFMKGYLADHTPIQASTEAWKWLVQLEREINPVSSVLPGAGGDLGKSLANRLSELKTMMGNPQSAYWKGDKAEALQEEYRKLIEAQEKIKARGEAKAA